MFFIVGEVWSSLRIVLVGFVFQKKSEVWGYLGVLTQNRKLYSILASNHPNFGKQHKLFHFCCWFSVSEIIKGRYEESKLQKRKQCYVCNNSKL
uniref:Uncharacterized protein n=1 Tax=Picea sitchensis TaxID=3332 RepID=D5AAY7_PICSI|nr:unknown [Picea sitchensis]